MRGIAVCIYICENTNNVLSSWLFIHSTSIVSYNTYTIYPLTKTDIFKLNKYENPLIVIYGILKCEMCQQKVFLYWTAQRITADLLGAGFG